MSRISRFGVGTMLAAGVLCACSGFHPRISGSSSSKGGLLEPRRPGEPAAGDGIGGRGIPSDAPAEVSGRAVGGERRVCRAERRPAGWIAVAYVSAGDGDCRGRAKSDSGATVAVLTYYADRPRDSILDVCADEPAPNGWRVDEAGADASDSCPGVERNGSTTYRLRRVR